MAKVFMSRVLLFLTVAVLTGCNAVKPEFKLVDPTEVAVVIGYEFAGSKSINRTLATTAYVAGLFTGGWPGLILMTGSINLNEILRTNDPVTMVDDFNDAVYHRIEEVLVAKGYKVTLLRKVPVPYEKWESDELSETYLTRVDKNYKLGVAELQASGADAVLYVEYRVDANITDMEQLQSMDAVDLEVNRVTKQLMAFSIPPDNKQLFASRMIYEPLLDRLSFEKTVNFMIDLDSWPDENE